MKTLSNIGFSCFIIITTTIVGCQQPNRLSQSSKKSVFSDVNYTKLTLLAEIINQEPMRTESVSFVLSKSQFIRILSTAESDVNLLSNSPDCLHKGDELCVYWKSSNKQINTAVIPLCLPNTKIGDTLMVHNIYKACSVYDNQLRKYSALVTIPWSYLGINPKTSKEIPLNFIIGDNDDKINQKAKVQWIISNGLKFKSNHSAFGKLILKEKPLKANRDGIIYSSFLLKSASEFQEFSSVPILNVVAGHVNDSQDLQAKVSSTWNFDNLFINVEIFDNAPRFFDVANFRRMSHFYDYPLLTDTNGIIVWKMLNHSSKYAGGAEKNRFVDTTIFLNAGVYKLNYFTDESHSWNYWDDSPPNSSFYGVKIFRISINHSHK